MSDPSAGATIQLLLDDQYRLRDRVLALADEATRDGWPTEPIVNGQVRER